MGLEKKKKIGKKGAEGNVNRALSRYTDSDYPSQPNNGM
jgi:hypothetical protein